MAFTVLEERGGVRIAGFAALDDRFGDDCGWGYDVGGFVLEGTEGEEVSCGDDGAAV